MSLDPTELRQERAKIVTAMRKLQDDMVEKGGETAEDTEKFAKMETECRALERVIEREEALRQHEADLAKNLDEKRNGTGHDRFDTIRYPVMDGLRQPSREEMERRTAFAMQGWLMAAKSKLHGMITEEHRAAAKSFGFDLNHKEIDLPISKDYRKVKNEWRNMSLTANAGGYTVPEGFVNNLEQALLTFGGVRQVADVMRTASGADLPWPTMNDTTNKGAILAENTSFGTSVDPTFAAVVFKAFKYSSKPIIVSNELLQDSAFDLASQIGGWLGTRIARIQNDHFTTGGGTTLPMGVVTASTEGEESASQTVLLADELINLEHSLDPAYRPSARWMLHDATLAVVRKMKFAIGSDQVGWMWQPSMQAGIPDRLMGYPYVINQSMASAHTIGEKVVLFGDFMKYKIRDVADIRLVRLDELFAQTDNVGFVAFLRSDGNLLDAGTNPVVHLTMKKT